MMSLILAALTALSAAWAADKQPAAGEQRYETEFVLWLAYTQETLPQVPGAVISLTQRAKGSPGWQSPLASHIFQHDDILKAYLTRIEKTKKKYGVLNPYDVELLTVMKRYLLESKQELLARFDRLAGELKIERPRPASEWKDSLPSAAGGPAAAPPKPGAKRWEIECGCDLIFDGKDWKPAAGVLPGSRE